MNIDYIREFQVFTRYLNFTQASQKLNLAQSNLSKHIMQMEKELNCTLVNRGPSISLSPAGRVFASESNKIIKGYNDLIEECIAFDESEHPELFVQDILANDALAQQYLYLIGRFCEEFPNTPMSIIRGNERFDLEDLISHDINAITRYEFGNIKEIIERYEMMGFCAIYMATESAVLWCNRNSIFATLPHISVKDLHDTVINVPSEQHDPLLNARESMFSSYDIHPAFNECEVDSYYDFLFMGVPYESCYIVLSSLMNDPRIMTRRDRRFIHFDDDTANIHSFIIMVTPKNKSEHLLFQFLKENSPTS